MKFINSSKFVFLNSLFFLFLFIPTQMSLAIDNEFEWDYGNHPKNMVERYTTVFNELPLEGEIHNKPWSGDYWPTQKGGISYRWFVRQPIPGDSIKRFGYKYLDMENYQKDIKNKKHLISQKTKLDFIKDHGP